ncbi:MAG TPA: (Fe-S)-binding protein [Symbiobacteriaceae bacterium]|nr:(Fe-S)-binding protein [Symbiobacteriaceae bacterium]
MRVSLFATCLVDTFYPEVGEATVRLLRRLGCTVDFPPGQTCCGQPAWNSGHLAEAAQMARATVAAFAASQYVVAPSGSCVGMIREHYPALVSSECALGAKTFELSEFLVRVLKVDLRSLGARFEHSVTFHTSCHTTRELGVRREPFLLLEQIEGLQLRHLERAELCCGFGGTFSVKLPEVAVAMADDKLADVRATGAEYLVGTDSSCLMHLRGRMNRTGGGPQVLHLAELLELATRPRKEGGR